ncbi:DUF3883 domain-containing protein [Fictibacillus nanhaiensis]|uniref:DUF3883 domain-containing protein n=1 Tax=Fictibacillus nanhaiensis TaxID=742169 RepID=UPI002E1BAD64|nr:DUF3883 domain-containing protein [Fictibacillus nanhaiensis]
MAESYGERVFIEMLQNADDANATSFCVYESKGHVFIANNGKPFDDADVMSICRSGASEKKRGDTIGYRGVGFKSTTYLSTNIYIHSTDCTFTFSKSLAAENLGGVEERKVPTIRIPFLVESLDFEIKEIINYLKQKGFTTIFVFCNANFSTLLQEVQAVTADYFLFLRRISNVIIDVKGNHFKGNVLRSPRRIEIQFKNRKSMWRILSNNNTQIALALNEKQEIIPCRKEEAVFHCYLPTYEPSPYLFKINSDFSTDPSRKHITLDERTEEALLSSVSLLFEAVKEGINSSDSNLSNVLSIVMQKNTFSNIAQFTEKQFQGLLQSSWLEMQDGRSIAPKDYIKKPSFLDDAEWNWIRQHTPLKQTLPKIHPEALSILDSFIRQYAKESYAIKDWITMLSDVEFVGGIPNLILIKLYSNLIKQIRNKIIITHEEFSISSCYFKKNNALISISNASKEELYMLLLEIKSHLTSSEIEWYIKFNNLETIERKDSINSSLSLSDFGSNKTTFNFCETNHGQESRFSKQTSEISRIKKSITRWRAAENQCVEFEEMQGNKAKDVSKQNLGYDVLSVTRDNQERYIEVKSIKSRGDKISMTNNEYTAAHINADSYFLCIIYEENKNIVFEYIQNPLEKLKLEKVVRQWEWICEEYEGHVFRVSND